MPILCLLWSYHNLIGILDHSNAVYSYKFPLKSIFKNIPIHIVDATYHYYHHAKYIYNYSEYEWLDEVFGTKYNRLPSAAVIPMI